jgi:hypothetical protein
MIPIDYRANTFDVLLDIVAPLSTKSTMHVILGVFPNM